LKSVCRNYGDDVAVLVELHDIDADFTMGAGNSTATIDVFGIDAMIYYTPIVTVGNLINALLALLIL
jgi:hypothetical protein